MECKSKTIQCHQCKANECTFKYPNGIPEYCQANKYAEIIKSSKKSFLENENARLHLATAKILKKGGYDWTRVQQCIEFAKELRVKKVGLAVCAGLIREGQEFAIYLERAKFEVISIGCMVGGIKPEEVGTPEEWVGYINCNPLAQAEILNAEKTELNFIYGLCVGHDTLFIKHSQAPVTYVVAKDTVTANNPGAVLTSTFHRIKLGKLYPKV
jgi:uncharacterized metal-binding protein